MARFTSFTVQFRYLWFSSGCGGACEEIESVMIA